MRLFTAFLHEQTDPDRFYGELAKDSVEQLARYTPLSGRTVVDVGGGPGYFCDAFRAAGAGYLGVDPDVGELSARGTPGQNMVRASGTELPVRDGAVDVCYSSNVLEHVSAPRTMLEEMCRVTRPGGIVFVSYTPWLSPWGGHETAPWHFAGGDFARDRYIRKNGHEPKNRFGETLFPISISAVLDWARGTPSAELLHAFPRYHPWWATWIVRIPGIREVASWNLAMVLRKKP
ncbi:methyltransferase domain-containing protein [Allosaccharopolyspora coralli]|uniref:Methyltransferase domain-containing protein n=1 Tax=Allosaccharopolyspora coralli TaxID=2665642 RepID=A0A5Q3Q6W4_9PSEU|nr:class I SAM-dependent methyltransferase [Allosaccharopolyspora coralli]QGK68904.1 methyltransferase domain-containing protein [Allosaccharopolyspora coralli]